MRSIKLALVILILASGIVQAQTASHLATSSYVNALKQKNYYSAATLFDSITLVEFRELMSNNILNFKEYYPDLVQ